MIKELLVRPRRLRRTEAIRDLVSETGLGLSHLVQPYFMSYEPKAEIPIPGFTGVNRWGLEKLLPKIEADLDRGLKSFMLFAQIPDAKKDEKGQEFLQSTSLFPEAIRALKARFGDDIVLMTDICLCPSTSHGHCGLLKGDTLDNDASVSALAQMAVVHAQAGADFLAPSDMMDGRVEAIRRALDNRGFIETAILAHTAKYASHYYGPFRNALGSAPGKMGPKDRKTYQMDFRNRTEALQELALDLAEGADIVMVKPALAYLDVIAEFKRKANVPVAAYSVGGEYEMVKLMAKHGLAEELDLALENLTAISRAGATIILTYFASLIAEKGVLR